MPSAVIVVCQRLPPAIHRRADGACCSAGVGDGAANHARLSSEHQGGADVRHVGISSELKVLKAESADVSLSLLESAEGSCRDIKRAESAESASPASFLASV